MFIRNEALYFSDKHDLPIRILGRIFNPEEADYFYPKDTTPNSKAVFVIGMRRKLYNEYRFPAGSVVLDPFDYIEPQKGVTIIQIGKNNGRESDSPATTGKDTSGG